MATQNAASITALNAGAKFSVRRVNADAAGVFEIIGAPERSRSHYIKHLHVKGGSAGDGFHLLRRACTKLGAAAQNITISDAATLKMGTGDFSIELWIRWVTGTLAAIPTLLTKLDGTEGFKLETTATGCPKFTLGDADEVIAITGAKTVCDGLWHHICVTVDRESGPENTITMYLDGVSHTSTTDETVEGTADAAGGDVVLTGVDNVSFALCGLGIYKALALTAATVRARFNKIRPASNRGASAPSPGMGVKFTGSETSLVCGLNMDEGEGTALYDVTGVNAGTGTDNTWDTNDGLPFGQHSMPPTIEYPAVGTFLDVAFDPPLQIGAGNPIRTLETDGSFEIQLCGYTR